MDASQREKALEEVQSGNPEATDFAIPHAIDEFLDGILYTIAFKRDGKSLENYAYCEDSSIRIFRNQYELFQGIAKKGEPKSVIGKLAELYGVSGSIAIILTIGITYLAVQQITIPDILANGLTVIIGFYFGAQTQKT